jgi:hypothetical protein
VSRSPVDILFDRVKWTCTRCGAASGTCSCWEKITLRCPSCKRTKKVYKDETDPVGTATVESLCDRCDDGGNKPDVHYYNALGQWFDGERFRPVRPRR